MNDELASSSQFDNFLLIGKGSYGRVFKASAKNQEEQDQVLAIKKIYLNFIHSNDKLKKYLDTVSSLDHPNIIKIVKIIESSNGPEIVMEFADCGDMHSLLFGHKKDPPVPGPDYSLSHAISWSLQMARGLQYLHEKGLIHRDIKPRNILMSNGYKRVRICDLDFCKDVDTHSSQFLGTRLYQAPEVTVSGKGLTKAVDTYSYGLTVWNILTKIEMIDDKSKLSHLHVCLLSELLTVMNECNVDPQFIDRILHEEPKERPEMNQVVCYWETLDERVNKVDPHPLMDKLNRFYIQGIESLLQKLKVKDVNLNAIIKEYGLDLDNLNNNKES